MNVIEKSVKARKRRKKKKRKEKTKEKKRREKMSDEGNRPDAQKEAGFASREEEREKRGGEL